MQHTRNIHGFIPTSTSNHLDQIEVNERSKYYRHATENDIMESIIHINREKGINEISSNFLVM